MKSLTWTKRLLLLTLLGPGVTSCGEDTKLVLEISYSGSHDENVDQLSVKITDPDSQDTLATDTVADPTFPTEIEKTPGSNWPERIRVTVDALVASDVVADAEVEGEWMDDQVSRMSIHLDDI